jgi:3-oxoacyl-[acyl-carrier protein] reductase
MFQFSNNLCAVVTGGSRGIGKEIASRLAVENIKVYALASSKESLKNIENIPNLYPIQCDISSRDSINDFLQTIDKENQSIDILVNNAGIHRDNILLRMTDKDWMDVMDINLHAPFHLMKYVLKGMIKKNFGRIINISSISGTDGNKGQSNYAASKGGLIALTKSLAKEVGKRNILVNCIAPGVIETDMISHFSETIKKSYFERIPLNKFGKPSDIANMVHFLCSEEASYITGQTFYIDGGMSLN